MRRGSKVDGALPIFATMIATMVATMVIACAVVCIHYQCARQLRGTRLSAELAEMGAGRQSEQDAELAQKLGQLQPSQAVFPPECVGQLASFGPA